MSLNEQKNSDFRITYIVFPLNCQGKYGNLMSMYSLKYDNSVGVVSMQHNYSIMMIRYYLVRRVHVLV